MNTPIRRLKFPRLYMNSIYMIISTIFGSGSGFIFWIVATRIFSPHDVGLASTIISCSNLIATFSIFGFNISLVRYTYDLNNSDLLNTCASISIAAAIIVSSLFVLGSNIWAKSIEKYLHNWIYALVFILLTLLATIIAYQRWGVFISNRNAKYYFYQTLISFSRVIMLPIVVFLGGLGIIIAYISTNLAATLFGAYVSTKQFQHKFKFILNKKIVKMIFKYSAINYFIDILSRSYIFLPPLIISNAAGLKQTAYFYVAWIITVLIYTLIDNVSISLLAEGSHNENEIKKYIKQAVVFIYLFVIPTIIIINIGGYKILAIFGRTYITKSSEYLKILIMSTLFYALNSVYISTKRIEKNMIPALIAYTIIALPPLALGYFLTPKIGIHGFCFIVTLSNITCAISILIYYICKDSHLYRNTLQ